MGNIAVYNQPLTVAEIRANVNLIQEVMKSVMKKDVHFGTIPGTQKPTLYKAGSEKILSTFRIAVELEVEDLSVYDSFRYRVKARGVLPSGEVVGCGIGECSTDEEKYRWRSAVNDREWDATPEDRKRVKYSKPNNWNKDGETKQIRTNPADLANTVLKMAKKRAQIDLTLTATAASDVFEQDIEDLPEEYRDGMNHEQGGKPTVAQPQPRSSQQPSSNGKPCTASQAKLIHTKLSKAGIPEDFFKLFYKIEHVEELPFNRVNDALERIGKGDFPVSEEAKAETPLPSICADCGQPIEDDKCMCEGKQ